MITNIDKFIWSEKILNGGIQIGVYFFVSDTQ